MTKSVFAGVDRSRIVIEPYPHVVAPNALDPALYAELEAAFPSFEKVVDGRAIENNKVYLRNAVEVIDDPEMPAVWREFFAYHASDAFFREMLEFWREPIAREYPDLERRFGKPLAQVTTGMRRRGVYKTAENFDADVMMDVQFGVNSPVTAPSTVRGPHVDKPEKLFAALLYFRDPLDDAEGGDLELYRVRTRRWHFDGRRDLRDDMVERFETVRYAPNTLVAWLNTQRSLHGVTPRLRSTRPRRYVNFIAECYRLTTPGFFEVKRSKTGLALSAVRRALGFRDA
jgi:hypothetical protein